MVKAKREELQASGQLTAAKEAELKALEAAAEVKRIEGQIASETAKQMKELFENTQLSGGAAIGAAADYEKLADSIGKVGDSADRAGESIADLNNRASGSAGSRIASTGVVDTRGEALRQGATLDNVDEVVKLANFEIERLMAHGEGPKALDRETLKSVVYDALRTASNQPQTTGTQDAPAQVAPIGGPVVHVNIAGRTTPINVQSGSDANVLVNILKQLQYESMRSV